ncbi:MAG: hypothetical protein MZV63_01275 [Marinilabiliales bacterium]|nr:hypothetical protein [Marinilabiliales bacterium]
MRVENIYTLLVKNLGYVPTQDQSDCMRLLAQYVTDNTNDVIFLLTGYAGTGKTSVIASLVSTLNTLRQKSVLLAPDRKGCKGAEVIHREGGLHNSPQDLQAEIGDRRCREIRS